jgi:hypothetical protein
MSADSFIDTFVFHCFIIYSISLLASQHLAALWRHFIAAGRQEIVPQVDNLFVECVCVCEWMNYALYVLR